MRGAEVEEVRKSEEKLGRSDKKVEEVIEN